MEQDPEELWTSVQDCIKIVAEQLVNTSTASIQDIKVGNNR